MRKSTKSDCAFLYRLFIFLFNDKEVSLKVTPSYLNVCSSCSFPLTNPICTKCHTRQLSLWLSDRDVPAANVQHIIKDLRVRASSDTTGNALCILCSTDLISVCTYCFFFRVENILKNSKIPKKFVEEFSESFNYVIYKGEYRPTLDEPDS